MTSDLAIASSIPPFQPDSDPATTAQRWKRWTQRVENLFVAVNLTDAARRKALFLHLAGEAVQESFDGLVIADPPAEPTPDNNVYTIAKQALDDFFAPKKNVTFEIYNFRLARQNVDETTDAYTARLRMLAKFCEFADIDNELKSHLIQTCQSTRLRRYALSEPSWTLKQFLDKARSMEAAERQVKTIESGTSVASSSVAAAVRAHQRRRPQPTQNDNTRRNDPPTQTCRNCGGAYPHAAGRKSCPAFGKSCNFCSKPNHFSKVCRSRQTSQQAPTPSTRAPPPTAQARRRRVRRVQEEPQLDNNHAVSSDVANADRDLVFSIGDHQKHKQPTAMLKVNGTFIRFILDTGASVNIIEESLFDKLKHKPPLQRAPSSIYAYGSNTPMITLGAFHAEIESKNKLAEALVYVIKGKHGSLLSYQTALQLDLIRLNVNALQQTAPLTTVEGLAATYPQLFSGTGKLKSHQVKLHIDESVKPCIQPHRRVPFHLQKKVEEELNSLLSQDIIEKVEGKETLWLSPVVVVTKPSDPSKVRICVDMRRANNAILRERFMVPSLDDLIHDLNGAVLFSRLDLSSAFHQLELSPECRYVTSFSTESGIYQYKRLFFGINCATEVFQAVMQQVLNSLQGVRCICDDILVYGRSQAEHDHNLRAVINRLLESGLTLNKAKCLLSQPELEWYGHVFSAEGLRVHPRRIDAIKQMNPPANAAEVKSFLSMIQYNARFIKNFAQKSEPLRRLIKQDTPFVWGKEEQHAFAVIQNDLCQNVTTSYYDPHRQTYIITDGSKQGVSALLAQPDDQGKLKIVSCASRSLTDVQTRWSQIELELFAVVFGCEKYHRYIYGADETIILSDHRPLLHILNNPAAKLPARLERLCLRLMAYRLRTSFIDGATNPADYASRHPTEPADSSSVDAAEEYVRFVVQHALPRAITLDEVKAATAADPVLSKVMQFVTSGDWSHARGKAEFQPYVNVKSELAVDADRSVVLRQTRLVIPTSLQQRIVDIAHAAHMGVEKTTSLIRTKCWFPRMHELVTQTVRACIACQSNTPECRTTTPLRMSQLPKSVWTELSADFAGPMTDGSYLLIVVDEYSRFPVVEVIHSTSADTVIAAFEQIFATFGNIEQLKTDNGPPWSSARWKEYAAYRGFKHRRITPLWPRADAMAEREVRTIMKAIRAATVNGKNWKTEINTFLELYRNTPHSTTNKTPAECIFGRRLRTRLPHVNEQSPASTRLDAQLRETDTAAKQKMKQHSDSHNRARERQLAAGDTVLVRQTRRNKLSSYYEPQPYVITDIRGSMITAQRVIDGRTTTRNISFFKRVPPDIDTWAPRESQDTDDELWPDPPDNVEPPGQGQPGPPAPPPAPPDNADAAGRRYPARHRQQPAHLDDYVVG